MFRPGDAGRDAAFSVCGGSRRVGVRRYGGGWPPSDGAERGGSRAVEASAAAPGAPSIRGSSGAGCGGHLEALVPERPFEAALDAAEVVAHRHAQEGGLGAHGEIPVAVAGLPQARASLQSVVLASPAVGGFVALFGQLPRAVEDEPLDGAAPVGVVARVAFAGGDAVEGRFELRLEVQRQPAVHLRYFSVICGRNWPSSWLTTSRASS